MKKPLIILALLLAGTMASHAQIRIGLDIITGSRQPNPSEMNAMRAEENAHPNITRAMHDVQTALSALQSAPDSFGGHKAQAVADLRTAYISLRKALYYRLYSDRR